MIHVGELLPAGLKRLFHNIATEGKQEEPKRLGVQPQFLAGHVHDGAAWS